MSTCLERLRTKLSPPSWCWSPSWFLESHWSLVFIGRLKTLVPNVGKRGESSSSRSNRADVLTNKEEGGQAMNIWDTSGRPCPLSGRGFPFLLLFRGNSPMGLPWGMPFSWSQMQSSWPPRLVSTMPLIPFLWAITFRPSKSSGGSYSWLTDEEATQAAQTFSYLDA